MFVGLAVTAAVTTATAAPVGATPVPLQCTLTAPAHAVVGQPVLLQLRVKNRGEQALDVLVWGTPFENKWFAPYVSVSRAGKALTYGGAMVKRGEPGPGDYVRIEAGGERQASFDVAQAFDLRTPGRYRVQPHIVLHDWVTVGQAVGQTTVPRPREQHVSATLACNAVGFVLGR